MYGSLVKNEISETSFSSLLLLRTSSSPCCSAISSGNLRPISARRVIVANLLRAARNKQCSLHKCQFSSRSPARFGAHAPICKNTRRVCWAWRWEEMVILFFFHPILPLFSNLPTLRKMSGHSSSTAPPLPRFILHSSLHPLFSSLAPLLSLLQSCKERRGRKNT